MAFFSSLHNLFRFRKKNTVVESLSNLVSKQTVDQLSEGKWLNNTVKIKKWIKFKTIPANVYKYA